MTDKRAFFNVDVGGKPAPEAHYSSGRWYLPQRYVIGWPAHDIVKVGTTSSGRRRYGAFLTRGGELLDLRNYRGTEYLDAERALQATLGTHWTLAFAHRDEAVPFLGHRGSGWLECYRIPAADWPRVIAYAGGV